MRSRSTSPKTSGPYFVPISEIKGGKRPLHNIPIPEKRRPKPKKRSNSVWDILGSLFPASCTSGEDFIPASPMHTTYRAPPPPTYRRCQLKPYSRPTSGRDTPQAVPTSPPRKKSASVTFSKSAHTTPAKRRFSFNRGSCASSLPSGDKWVPGQAKAFGELQQSGLLEEDKKGQSDVPPPRGRRRSRALTMHGNNNTLIPTDAGVKLGTDKSAFKHRRSASVDALWFRQRKEYEHRLSSAWWKLEQAELDDLRNKSRRRASRTSLAKGRISRKPSADTKNSSSGSTMTTPVPERRRAIRSPLLAANAALHARRLSRVAGIPGVPGVNVPNLRSALFTGSRSDKGTRQQNTKRKFANKTLHSRNNSVTVPSQKEVAKWRDLKQVDKLYNQKLIYRRDSPSRSSRSSRRQSSVSLGYSRPNSRNQSRPSTPQLGNSSTDTQAIRRLKFWEATVIPGWKTIATTPLVRRTWERYGVPPTLRRYVWPLALGCEPRHKRREMFEDSLKREETLMMRDDTKTECDDGPRDLGSHAFGPARLESIMQDLNRMNELDVSYDSTRKTSDSRRQNRSLRAKVRAVVVAFLGARPGVSYVQGMSYLALVLLRHMDPADAFGCLCNLLDCDYFHAYLDMNAEQIRFVFHVFDTMFQLNLPRLHKHFTDMGLVPDCYLVEWCMTLFSKNLTMETASRVWDGYLVHGEMFVFRVAVAILMLMEKALSKGDLNFCMKMLRSRLDDIGQDELVGAARTVRTPPEIVAELAQTGGAHSDTVRKTPSNNDN